MSNYVKIIKGTNRPLSFTFSEKINFKSLEISLRCILKELKHWSLRDVELVESSVIAPQTREETLEYKAGPAYIELKWMNEEGYVDFCEYIKVIIVDRDDETILGGSTDGED